MQKILVILCLLILVVPVVFGAAFLQNYVYEGEVMVIPYNGGYYEITLVMVSDTQEKAIFSVNGEMTKALGERERDYLSDGSKIFVGDILIDEDGKDLVEFYFIGTGGNLVRKTVAEKAEIPYEEMQPGLIEEQPMFKEACEGCTMNGECLHYGYTYEPDRDTEIVCTEDGSWQEKSKGVVAAETSEAEGLFAQIVSWFNSFFLG